MTATATERNEAARTQTTTLRYEVSHGSSVASVEKPWLLHWYTQSSFGELATAAGLDIAAIVNPNGQPAPPDAESLAFVLKTLRG